MTTYKMNLFFLLLFISTQLYARSGPEDKSDYQSKPLVTGQHSMIVTNNTWATKAAETILNKGGNAFDAAIAAGFVLGLTEPQSSGIGGGGYALTYSQKNHQLLAYDGRETAPHSANPNWFLDKNGNTTHVQDVILSAKSIGVPGEVALFYKLHKDKGKLPWNTLLQPAIILATHGFPMSARLHKLLLSDRDMLAKDMNVRNVYFNGKNIKDIGQIVKNPAYANTLSTIAKNPQDFYRGRLAENIIQDINVSAGKKLYNLNDFINYHIVVHPAVCSVYRNTYHICSVPPSASGGVTTQELLGIYANRYHTKNYHDSQWMYYFLEASKLAFADRNKYLADPAFVKQPVQGLLNKDYIKNRSLLIKDRASETPVPAGILAGMDTHAPDNSEKIPGTTSIAIVDKYGNAISMTVTIESQFGSHIFTHGFFLNNELTDFSFAYKDDNGKLIANRIEPGKRPRSSISPTMVFNKEHQLYAITGSPGGSEIICYVAKNLILMLDMGMKPDTASSLANLCATNTNPAIETFREPIQAIPFLLSKGEMIIRRPMVSGITNILHKPEGGWYGAADPRREGVANGG